MSNKKPLTLNKTAKDAIRNEAIEETMILVAAYLMDELEYDENKIIELWDGVERYSVAVNNHLISVANICKIIEEHTGLQILKKYAKNTINRR